MANTTLVTKDGAGSITSLTINGQLEPLLANPVNLTIGTTYNGDGVFIETTDKGYRLEFRLGYTYTENGNAVTGVDTLAGLQSYIKTLFPKANPAAGGAVKSVNSKTGDVVLTQDDIAAGANNAVYTTAEKAKVAATATPYLGQVATRCRISLGKYNAATGQWIQYKSMHWSRDKIVNPTVVIPHFYVSTANVETNVTGGTIDASIEYPSGVFTRANEVIANSNNPIACGNGFTVLTFNVTIPNNAQFWVRGLEINDNGPVYAGYANGQYNQPSSEGFESGTGTPTNKITGGTIAAGGGFSKAPVLILGMAIRPSVLIIGDSRSVGGNEGTYDITGDVGETARSIGPVFGYTNFGISSSTLGTYLSSSRTYRDQIVNGTIAGINSGGSYFSHIINSYAFNDLNAGTVATLVTNHTTLANLYQNNIIIGTTAVTNATSSDGYATTTNQTPTNTWPKIRDYNEAVRAGITGEKFYFDVADAIDPDRRGVFPVSRNLFATARPTSAIFTGSISGTTLTVTAITSGTLSVDDPITDNLTGYPGTVVSTVITGQLTGTVGGIGTYSVNNNQSKTSRTLYVGGFGTNDGTHISAQLSQLIKGSGKVNTNLIRR